MHRAAHHRFVCCLCSLATSLLRLDCFAGLLVCMCPRHYASRLYALAPALFPWPASLAPLGRFDGSARESVHEAATTAVPGSSSLRVRLAVRVWKHHPRLLPAALLLLFSGPALVVHVVWVRVWGGGRVWEWAL